MDKNKMDEGNKGPGVKWNPNSVGGYSRGLDQTNEKSIPSHNRGQDNGPKAKK